MPYFAPALYNITVLLSTCYCIASIIRVWIAWGEKKITQNQRSFFNFCFCFLALGVMVFSLIFAVQPKDHLTLIIHSSPFIVLEVALGGLHVS